MNAPTLPPVSYTHLHQPAAPLPAQPRAPEVRPQLHAIARIQVVQEPDGMVDRSRRPLLFAILVQFVDDRFRESRPETDVYKRQVLTLLQGFAMIRSSNTELRPLRPARCTRSLRRLRELWRPTLY